MRQTGIFHSRLSVSSATDSSIRNGFDAVVVRWKSSIRGILASLRRAGFITMQQSGISRGTVSQFVKRHLVLINRRAWKTESSRLLNACLTDFQIKLKMVQKHNYLYTFMVETYSKSAQSNFTHQNPDYLSRYFELHTL